MTAPQLSVVTPIQSPQSAERESPATRAARLLTEARQAADEQVEALERAIQTVVRLAGEIAEGGEAYPPGARDISRRLAEEMAWKAQTLESIGRHAGR